MPVSRRLLNASSRGFLCAVATPEGEGVGLSFTLTTRSTVSTRSSLSPELLSQETPLDKKATTLIFVDGCVVGKARTSGAALSAYRIPSTCSVTTQYDQLWFWTTPGNLLRPLSDGRWVSPGDPRGLTPEFSPGWVDLLGWSAAQIPFARHNPPIRLTYQTAQVRKAMPTLGECRRILCM